MCGAYSFILPILEREIYHLMTFKNILGKEYMNIIFLYCIISTINLYTYFSISYSIGHFFLFQNVIFANSINIKAVQTQIPWKFFHMSIFWFVIFKFVSIH